MVYRDYWALAQWYRHYGNMVGCENLFVVAHGADRKIAEICPKASILTIPRDSFRNFDGKRERMLNSFHSGLGEYFDWVIRTDSDELLCIDPDRYGSIADVLSSWRWHGVFGYGIELVESPTDAELSGDEPVFMKRRLGVFSGQLSKAWAGRKTTRLFRHGVRVDPEEVEGYNYYLPKGVFLVHLKYANLAVLPDRNCVRQEVGASGEEATPGFAWKKPMKKTRNFLDYFGKAELVDWRDAELAAREALAGNPLRRTEKGLVKSAYYRPKHKFQLPEWFEKA